MKNETSIPPLKLSEIKLVEKISVRDFYEENRDKLELRLVNSPQGFARPICEPSFNRPGLALTGFYDYFERRRIQVFGLAEVTYLQSLGEELRKERLEEMFRRDLPCVIFARAMDAPRDVLELADRHAVCVFQTELATMKFVNAGTFILENAFAESTTVHGCMLDIRGIGVLIVGDSGVGKSETALGLVERGASLVADDIVRLHKIGGELMGSAPEMSRGFIEVRGLGIVNVIHLFGQRAVSREKRLDLVILLKPGIDPEAERVGIEPRDHIGIVGVKVAHVTLPVAPGRDTSRLVEVAALDQYMRSEGHEMAREFNHQLRDQIGAGKRMS